MGLFRGSLSLFHTNLKKPLGLRLPKGKFRIIKIEFDPLALNVGKMEERILKVTPCVQTDINGKQIKWKKFCIKFVEVCLLTLYSTIIKLR